MVESGLLTVLDLAKTAPQQSKLDQISLLLAIKGETDLVVTFSGKILFPSSEYLLKVSVIFNSYCGTADGVFEVFLFHQF